MSPLRPIALLLALATACVPVFDETDSDDGLPSDSDPWSSASDTDDTDGTVDEGELVGDWLSEQDDLSELLATYFDIIEVSATFAASGSYEVSSVDVDGATLTYSGTYVLDESTAPASITMSQTSPEEATAVGIVEVSGDTLTYEVVQTVPDYGYTPPTPETGFGSSSGPGLAEGVNVQTFRRQQAP